MSLNNQPSDQSEAQTNDASSTHLDLTNNAFVEVKGLKKYYPVHSGLLNRKVGDVRAVDGVDFSIPKGDTFGLVGESGSGKTTCGKVMLRIEEPTSGEITIDGRDITELSGKQIKKFRRNAQMIHQDPTSSLNPRKRVRDIITEPMKIHDIGTPDERVVKVEELLETVGLPRDYMYKYPSALSGGQKQRVVVARALTLNPDFIVLDEPTSALDVSVQAQLIDLLGQLQDELGLTYLFISHNLSLIYNVSDWIGVLYLGKLVEVGPASKVFHNPLHPYTRALLSAIPTVTEADKELKPEKIKLEGEIPDPLNRPEGCAFSTRCDHAFGPCHETEPKLREVEENHYSRCYLFEEEHNPGGPEWASGDVV